MNIEESSKLSNEELRSKVAEKLGVKILRSCGDRDEDHKNQVDTEPNSIGAWVRWCRDCDAENVCSIHGNDRFWSLPDADSRPDAPNYPEDLNACAHFETAMTPDQHFTYLDHCTTQLCGQSLGSPDLISDSVAIDLIFMDARTRCIAFLCA